MSSKLYEVQVRIPDHLRKFVLARYGGDGLTFYQNLHEMGLYICSFSADRPEYYRPGPAGTSYMKFKVKRGLAERINGSLFKEEEKLYQYLPLWLEFLFHNSLITWIAAGRALDPNTKIKKMVELFLRLHGIEDEVDMKNLRQTWFRRVTRDKECIYEHHNL